MKERPILFSGPMVRALLREVDPKVQTRRIVRALPGGLSPNCYVGRNGERWCFTAGEKGGDVHGLPCPYGAPGDRLWVRETWRSWERTCDEDSADEEHEHTAHCRQTYVAYAATPREGFRPVPDRARITYLDEATPLERNPRLLGPWKPSIHIPRSLSRIDLELEAVRAEQLQAMTDDAARAEGVTPIGKVGCPCEGEEEDPGPHVAGCSWGDPDIDPVTDPHLAAFRVLWDAINGKRAAWASNPWVWVLGFRRLP